jgi:hypothetical protein
VTDSDLGQDSAQIHALDPNFTCSNVASCIQLSIHVSTYAPLMHTFLRRQFFLKGRSDSCV